MDKSTLKVMDTFLQRIPESQFNYMINISPRLDFIYFSIPKNACSTIKVLLRSLFEDINKIRTDVHDRQNSLLLRPCDIGYENFLKMLEDSSVFKFTVVRNPYSRILSAYLDKFIKLPKYDVEGYQIFLSQLVGGKEIDEYTSNISFLSFLKLINEKQPYGMNEHWRPQVIQGMIDLIDYDKIYRFESLETSLNDLVEKLKARGYWTEEKTLQISEFTFKPHSTKAEQLVESYYTKECLSIFNKVYQEDIRRLDYAKIN